MPMPTFTPLAPELYRDLVRRALAEDVGGGDITTAATVSTSARGRGAFIVKEPCVLAGLDVAFEVFRQLAALGSGAQKREFSGAPDPELDFSAHKHDGDRCATGDVVADVFGSAAVLLIGERTALNFLQRLSAIAT